MTNTCYSCACEAELELLPAWQRIAVDDHWRVAHAKDAALLGWLVLMPRRHVLELADLTEQESAVLGRWQVGLAAALRSVLGVDKTYVAQFGEAPGFHLHFHIVARPTDLDEQVRGPGVFGLVGREPHEQVTEDERDTLAQRLRACL